MTMYFSIHWQRIAVRGHIIQVQITFLDELGNTHKTLKHYENWIGVCTKDIEKVIHTIHRHFPNHNFHYEQIGSAKKVLPYFEERLAKNKLEYRSKPFYKLYTSASHKDVGKFLNRYKIGYYDPDDWLTRIYIDLCTRHDTYSFYYKWYDIEEEVESLMDSLHMIPDRRQSPDWTIAAFDIESVPMKGHHIPIGYHESDRIVMISLYKWNKRQGIQKWLLYVLPDESCPSIPGYEEGAFLTEAELLIRFHELLEDVHILTGYNINAFDLPCIYARLLWLKLYELLKRYTSCKVGMDVVVSYHSKMTIDLYPYFKTFSGYDLPSYKLDDVARVKLGGDKKLSVKATGIWSWYRNNGPLVRDLILEEDVQRCFDLLKPETVSKASSFGTFRTYLDYCLKDSELVYRLFEKEFVLSFLVERANFTALNAVEVLHLGNSRYLLELFKTYGLRLQFFIQPKFFEGFSKTQKQTLLPDGKTYQGALNFCTPEKIYEDVSVMDFTSMYPSTLLSSNLCYGTCTIMTRDAWLSNPLAQQLTSIPYRQHSDLDFTTAPTQSTEHFSYPTVTETDRYVIVMNTKTKAFLPEIVRHFIQMRQHHQQKWKETRDVYHYNVQLGIKILINSLYGVMANKDSPLAYLVIAMTIVTLSRYQLLGSYHYLKSRGYDVCYADTDSLMVHRWPVENCNEVNQFLNLPHVELKYEQRMKRLLVLSKKRYVYENKSIVTKGFQKKINGLIEFMTENILNNVWHHLFEDSSSLSPAMGWILWVETILEANYRCRDPKKYCIYRKMKNLEEYKSKNCPSVKYLKKYPDRVEEHVEFTYSRADVAASEASNWVMDVDDCQWVNYEQLFMSQKKIFITLLNMTYWHLPNPIPAADMVLNTVHWKRFVHAELLHWHATGNYLSLMVESGLKYTFTINDHLTKERRGPGRKRKHI